MARSQFPVRGDGPSISGANTAAAAKKNVDRGEGGVPIHACGAESYRECPCWTCVSNHCAACAATLF